MKKKKTYERVKNAEDMEGLRSNLNRHIDNIIEGNIKKEVLMISKKLDKIINSFYQENTNGDNREK